MSEGAAFRQEGRILVTASVVDSADLVIRPALRSDAGDLARFVNMAGEGLPLHLWSKLATDNEDPWEIGRRRALREAGGFSFRNAVVVEVAGRSVGCMIGYRLADEAAAIDYAALPPMFAPLEELEAMAAGTWYVNVLAVEPETRGRGIGATLLALAEMKAKETGAAGTSIIVADGNETAMRLYMRSGFKKVVTRPIVKEDWESGSKEWILLTRMSDGSAHAHGQPPGRFGGLGKDDHVEAAGRCCSI